jgi:hypothetical protein
MEYKKRGFMENEKKASTFTFDLPVEQHRQVKVFCAKNGLKIREFLLQAVDLMLNKKENEETKE